jgi:hypothetical protein
MKEASNHFVKFWMEDGIMYSHFLKDIHIDLENIQEFIKFRHEFSQGEKQYWLHDLNGLKTMSKDAKEFGDKYGQEFLHAGALIAHTHLQKFIFNTFIIVKKPRVKTFVFTNKESAKKWLLELKQKALLQQEK